MDGVSNIPLKNLITLYHERMYKKCVYVALKYGISLINISLYFLSTVWFKNSSYANIPLFMFYYLPIVIYFCIRVSTRVDTKLYIYIYIYIYIYKLQYMVNIPVDDNSMRIPSQMVTCELFGVERRKKPSYRLKTKASIDTNNDQLQLYQSNVHRRSL